MKTDWDRKFKTRDLTYSFWHCEYCGRHHSCIDIDSLEYCALCGELLALIEVAWDKGQERKSTTVMRRLANKAQLPAYLVFYTKDKANADNITAFRVRQVYPKWGEEQRMTPEEYHEFLCKLRDEHYKKRHPSYPRENIRTRPKI